MDCSTFQDIIQESKSKLFSIISKIQNETIQDFFKDIEFQYLNESYYKDESSLKTILIHVLNDYKFISYGIFIKNVIVIVENKCIIIESTYVNSIEQIIGNINYSINANDLRIKTKIDNFFEYFFNKTTANEFFNSIFKVTSCYLIHRYFYPTHYFKNPSFFIYKNESINLHELKFKQKMQKFFCQITKKK